MAEPRKKAKLDRGRPTKFKPEYCEQLVEHMKQGFPFGTFAAIIHVNEDTLYEWCHKHEIFSEAKKKGKKYQELWWISMGRQAVMGQVENFNSTTFVWMTKNLIGWRDKHEIVEQQSISRDSNDGLAELPRLLELYRQETQPT